MSYPILSASGTTTILADNTVAIAAADPALCGAIVVTATDTMGSGIPVTVALTAGTSDNYDFVVSQPPTSVAAGIYTFDVAISLLNWPAVVHNHFVDVELLCPIEPQLIETAATLITSPYAFDLLSGSATPATAMLTPR